MIFHLYLKSSLDLSLKYRPIELFNVFEFEFRLVCIALNFTTLLLTSDFIENTYRCGSDDDLFVVAQLILHA